MKPSNNSCRILFSMALLAAAFLILTLGAVQVSAQTTFTYTLSNPNPAISTYPAGYQTVTVNLNAAGTVATVIFNSLTATSGANTYLYLMGDGSTISLNVNGTATPAFVSEANTATGFTPTFDKFTAGGQTDGFGNFSLQMDNKDGFGDTATQVTITLTKSSGTWTDASTVLIANSLGNVAASHTFVCLDNSPGGCNQADGALATGFSGPAGGTNVPEPATMLLFGSGLVALGAKLRHRKSRIPAA